MGNPDVKETSSITTHVDFRLVALVEGLGAGTGLGRGQYWGSANIGLQGVGVEYFREYYDNLLEKLLM